MGYIKGAWPAVSTVELGFEDKDRRFWAADIVVMFGTLFFLALFRTLYGLEQSPGEFVQEPGKTQEIG